LVSQRGRKVLGKRVFVFEKSTDFNAADVLSQIVWQIYEFYAPREIRVSVDFPSRKFLGKVLSLRANRKIKINVVGNNPKITTERAFGRTKFEFDFRQIKSVKNLVEIQMELVAEFQLKRKPKRIEAFDVAHISGTDFVASKSIWASGKFSLNEYQFWLLHEASELETLETGIANRFESQNEPPDLILIDGGKSQLKAALKAVEKLKNRKFSIVAAVKPPGKHGEVSHFILENGSVVKMKSESETMQMLVLLRDEAHDLANSVHRRRRDTAHFYELAALLPSINEKERRLLLQKYGSLKQLKLAGMEDLIKIYGTEKAEIVFRELQNKYEKVEPLIVPIRFDDESGDARDLQPISKKRI
jgi:excinuclease ABC subunit C